MEILSRRENKFICKIMNKNIIYVINYNLSPSFVDTIRIQEWCSLKGLCPEIISKSYKYFIYKYNNTIITDVSIEMYAKWISKLHKELCKIPYKFTVLYEFKNKNYIECVSHLELLNTKSSNIMLEILNKLNDINLLNISMNKVSKRLIHGDLYPSNILCLSHDKLCFIDFEQASYFYQSYEVLRFFFHTIDLNSKKNYIFIQFHRYITEYTKINELSKTEWYNSLFFYLSILVKDSSMALSNPEYYQFRANIAKFIFNNLDELFLIIVDVLKKKE